MNKKLCPICEERPIRRYDPDYSPPECLICYNKRFNHEKVEKRKKKTNNSNSLKETKKSEKLAEKEKILNTKWIEREYKQPEATAKQRFRNTQGHAYVNEPSFLKKFNSVRG